MKKCFVIMPFKEEFDEVFEYAITPAASDRGYYCTRMDRAIGPINLIHEMIHNIYEADLIIADLTGKSANVFYELGVAHSIAHGGNTIMIAEHKEELPFDIASYKVCKYVHSMKGIHSLQEILIEQIEFIETQKPSSTNPIRDYLLKQKTRNQQQLFPPRLRQGPRDQILNQLNLSIVQLTILSLLNGLSRDVFGLTIGDICSSLGIQKRKYAALALREMKENGIVGKKKLNKSTYWHISDFGREIFNKMKAVIKTRIIPYGNGNK